MNNFFFKWFNLLINIILSLPRHTKRLIVLSTDIFLCFFTVWFAFYLRLNSLKVETEPYFLACLLSICISVPIFWRFGLYLNIFRYSGLATIKSIIKSVFIYSIIFCTTVFYFKFNGIPRTIGIIQPILFFLLVVSSRVIANLILHEINFEKTNQKSLVNILIYKANEKNLIIASSLLLAKNTKILGFIEDNQKLVKQFINGIPVFSIDNIDRIFEMHDIQLILYSSKQISRYEKKQLLNYFKKYNVAIRNIPSIDQFTSGKISLTEFDEIDIQDLLGRAQVDMGHMLKNDTYQNKNILITGAGGSIGSEISYQILNQRPNYLILLDINEFNIYNLQLSIKKKIEIDQSLSNIKIVYLLGSILDEKLINKTLSKWSIDIIFHTAAYKHVPLVEENITSSLKNNILGTKVIANLALKNEVKNLIYISSDKAVRPTNLMGASKRFSEIILQSLNSHVNQSNKVKFSMVRFGNVLHSSGSVIPLFSKQISDGGPITLTHPDITRYFMSIKEAAQLVIKSGSITKGGEVFVLDMGQPIKILDLAKKMIHYSGNSIKDKNNPNGNIEIKIIGLRPAEKLYEELLIGNNPKQTEYPKIIKADEKFINWDSLEKQLELLEKYLNNFETYSALKIVSNIVEEINYDIDPLKYNKRL